MRGQGIFPKIRAKRKTTMKGEKTIVQNKNLLSFGFINHMPEKLN